MPSSKLSDPLEVARLRQDDPDVGQGRLDQQDGNVTVAERSVKRAQVVVRNDPGRQCRIDRRSHIALAGLDMTIRGQGRDRLVDRAVIAEVVDGDLWPTGHHPGQPDGKAVRIGCAERELPVFKSEPTLELLTAPDRVLGRQHVGDPPAVELAFDRRDGGWGAMAGHRTSVAQAEVDVLMAIDVTEMGPRGALDEDREPARPLDHPVHRHAGEE